MKGIVINPDNRLTVKDFDAPLYKSVGDAVDGWIEIVHPGGLKDPFVMIVNDEGLIKGLPWNVAGCLLYGTPVHGSPIVGNIVIMKEGWTDDGKDLLGLSEEEIAKITNKIDALLRCSGRTLKTEN